MNLDKLMLKNPNLTINKFNCYKIFFICLLETIKLYDDFVIPKSILCKVAIIDSSELLALEAEFLQKVDYSVYIEEAEFFKYKLKLKGLYEGIIKAQFEQQPKPERQTISLLNKQKNECNNAADNVVSYECFKRKCSYFSNENNDSNDFLKDTTSKNFCEL